jgi:cytochrome P450
MADNGHQLTGARAAGALTDLGFASIAAGVIARRRPVIRLLERIQADTRAGKRMTLLRDEFGSGPVELVIPGRRILVILDPDDVAHVLEQAPTPFHPANLEKRKALQWFQPHGVLISRGPIRQQRRLVNEAALQTGAAMHQLSEPFAAVIAEEAAELVAAATKTGQLDSSAIMTAWWRVVRRVVLGDAARDDEALTNELLRLRQAGNWSFLSLPHYRRRSRFIEHLYRYAEEPQPGTLVSALADTPSSGAVDPVGQLPQWIFAFDAAGMALCRALALLATHSEQREVALRDCAEPERPLLRPYLRASMLESIRIWPTTPTILRDTTEDTQWGQGADRFTVPAGAALMIVTPAFHRDDQLLPFAHRFAPEIWLDGQAKNYPQLVPFSAGPAECPGRNVVLLTTSSLLANLLGKLELRLQSTHQISPAEPLPMTLNQLTLRFAVEPAQRAVSSAISDAVARS